MDIRVAVRVTGRVVCLLCIALVLQPHLYLGSLLFDRVVRYETYKWEIRAAPCDELPNQLLRLTAFPLCFKVAGELGRWPAYFLTKGEMT